MGDEIFGPIITGDDVRSAVEATIQKWIGTYLAVLARKTGRAGGDLPVFQSYTTLFQLDKYAEDIVPACVVVAPGLMDQPANSASEGYRARWGVGVGCVVAGQDPKNTYELATLYTAAVRMLAVQNQSLGGFADGVLWVSERYDNLDSSDLRTIAAGTVQLGVDVKSVTDPRAGATQPVADLVTPPDAWPTADRVLIEIDRS